MSRERTHQPVSERAAEYGSWIAAVSACDRVRARANRSGRNLGKRSLWRSGASSAAAWSQSTRPRTSRGKPHASTKLRDPQSPVALPRSHGFGAWCRAVLAVRCVAGACAGAVAGEDELGAVGAAVSVSRRRVGRAWWAEVLQSVVCCRRRLRLRCLAVPPLCAPKTGLRSCLAAVLGMLWGDEHASKRTMIGE